jgi:hypothetical protein
MVNRERGPKTPHIVRQLNDVEREIVLADIAYLKQKEIESGDWAKWEADQKKLKDYSTMSGTTMLNIMFDVIREVRLNDHLLPPQERDFITEAKFTEALGRPPGYDDMERANCADVGKPGHHFCGWCHVHDKPRWLCMH